MSEKVFNAQRTQTRPASRYKSQVMQRRKYTAYRELKSHHSKPTYDSCQLAY